MYHVLYCVILALLFEPIKPNINVALYYTYISCYNIVTLYIYYVYYNAW